MPTEMLTKDEQRVSQTLPPTAPTGSGQRNGRLARWAVGLSALFAVAIAASIATFATAYALGGASATEDNWVAYLVLSMGSVGLIGSFAAFVLATIAKVKGDRWALLWLPLCVFPAFFLFLVLGEAFWWE